MKKMLIGAFALSLAVTASAGALAEKYNLMFSHTLTENDPYHQAFVQWADAVSERTNGELTIDVYANAQLGAEEDVIEQMRMGANIGHNTDFARLGNYVPEVAVFNGPYMLESMDDVKKAQQLDCVKEWEKRLEEEFGLKVLSFAYVQGYRNVISNKPVTKPEDLSGMKIRTAGQSGRSPFARSARRRFRWLARKSTLRRRRRLSMASRMCTLHMPVRSLMRC